ERDGTETDDPATTTDTGSNELAEPESEPETLPARRSDRQLRARLDEVAGKVRACGKQAGLFPGESVQVRLRIAPSGRVQSAKVQGAFSRSGAACIETAVRSMRLSPARRPQTAKHRFTL
ncbi:MAG: hypothetical protein AB1Z98_12295, partial [Nannocystaceae bacterium]